MFGKFCIAIMEVHCLKIFKNQRKMLKKKIVVMFNPDNTVKTRA